MYNYQKLLGKIKEVFNDNSSFASAMEKSERTISLKLNNKREFKQSEIIVACELLNIRVNEIPSYFFELKVQRK